MVQIVLFMTEPVDTYEANDFYQQMEHVLEEKNRIRNWLLDPVGKFS